MFSLLSVISDIINSRPKSKPANLLDDTVIIDGPGIDVQVHGLNGFTKEQREFAIEVFTLMARAISSQEFQEQALKMRVRETNGMTNRQLLDKVLSGWDQNSQKNDGDLDFIITLYNRIGGNGTVGYTYSYLKIWTNRYHFARWFRSNDKAACAGHWFHEYLHCLGLGHRIHKGSAVYEWGYLLREVCKKLG